MIGHQVYSNALVPSAQNYRKWTGPSIDSADPLHFELKVWMFLVLEL